MNLQDLVRLTLLGKNRRVVPKKDRVKVYYVNTKPVLGKNPRELVKK